MNKPDDFECWRLPDDDSIQKLTVQKETKIANAATFTIEREDHTLGNMLRMQLLDDPQVIFSGYRQPHPLEPAIQLRVQTRTELPGPKESVETALDHLQRELGTFHDRFLAAVKNSQGGR